MYLSLKYTVKESFPTISNNEESNEFRDFDKIAYFFLKISENILYSQIYLSGKLLWTSLDCFWASQ